MANLGDIGNFKIHADLRDALRVPIFIGQMQGKKAKSTRLNKAFMWYAPKDPVGRGNLFTVPTLNKVVLTLQGRFVNIAQGGSGAMFYDVASGSYYAYELNGSACWKVEITSSTVTVTPQSSGGGGSGTSASAYVLT